MGFKVMVSHMGELCKGVKLYQRGSPLQSCKNLGSVVALLQGNFEKSHDFKANFEEKRVVLILMSKNPKTFDHTQTFHFQT